MPNPLPETFNQAIAHLTHPDGSIFQVLNEAQDDWDEAATHAAYNAYNEIHPG